MRAFWDIIRYHYFFLAHAFLAHAFLATGFLTATFFATGFFAATFLATGFFAATFFTATFFATGFFAATFFTAGFFAATFFAAGFFTATFFAAGFLAATGFFAAGFFAAVFKNVNAILLSFRIVSLYRTNSFVLDFILYERKKLVKKKMILVYIFYKKIYSEYNFLNPFSILRIYSSSLSRQYFGSRIMRRKSASVNFFDSEFSISTRGSIVCII